MDELRVSGKTVHKLVFPFHREVQWYDDCCDPINSKDNYPRVYQLLKDANYADYWENLYNCFNNVSVQEESHPTRTNLENQPVSPILFFFL